MYNNAAAVEYARKWALGRNPRYYNFTGQGGDCTNFISQALFAGSGEMNWTPVTGWYYSSPTKRTASWSGVQYLYNFLIHNAKVGGPGPKGKEVGIEELVPGDLVQLSFGHGVWSHSLLVTEITDEPALPAPGSEIEGAAASEPYTGHVLISTHTNDAIDRPLNSYIYEKARYIKIY